MKEITLSQDKVALVDDEDFEYLSQWKWSAYKAKNNKFYAHRKEFGNKTVIMHRLIMKAKGREVQIDHINNNGLDNRRCNLRLATNSQNGFNKKVRRDSGTGIKGAFYVGQNREKPYVARITINGKRKHLGYFYTAQQAGEAYKNAARELQGEFYCGS